jgi:hypothetical protein
MRRYLIQNRHIVKVEIVMATSDDNAIKQALKLFRKQSPERFTRLLT